jgi:hypothetical protein
MLPTERPYRDVGTPLRAYIDSLSDDGRRK